MIADLLLLSVLLSPNEHEDDIWTAVFYCLAVPELKFFEGIEIGDVVHQEDCRHVPVEGLYDGLE